MLRSEGDMSLKNPVTPPGIDPETVGLVVQRLNHYATPRAPLISRYFDKLRNLINAVRIPYRFVKQSSINESQQAKEMNSRCSIDIELRASCDMFRLIKVIFRGRQL